MKKKIFISALTAFAVLSASVITQIHANAILGDVNHNSVLDVNDACAILEHCASIGAGNGGTLSDTALMSADYSVNGKIDARDAFKILVSLYKSGQSVPSGLNESETRTTENTEKMADKQLVKAVLMEYHEYYTEEEAEEHAGWLADSAEPYLPAGRICSEEDAIEKARAILIADMGQDYIDRIEKNFTIYEGQEVKVERNYPPYTVTYYESYDVWLIFTHPLSGKLVDIPVTLATPGTFPDVLLRANDGKVLGIGDFG